MSQETLETLNTLTLIGFTEQRKGLPWFRADGKAWHYSEAKQGDEDNHYPGAIPPDEVVRRLFNFEVIEAKAAFLIPCTPEEMAEGVMDYMGEDGLAYRVVLSQAGRKGMLRDDTEYDLGVFKGGYQGHAYKEWLLDITSNIIDDSDFGLGIGSAGLLREGAQAWVSIELPDTMKVAGEVEFRSQLTGWTSFDGSLSTGWGRHVQIIVCDNTREIAHGEAARSGQIYKVKHSKNSKLRLKDAREALNVVHTMNDEFAKQVEALVNTKVSEKQFFQVLDAVVPQVKMERGKDKKITLQPLREKKREEIIHLYRADPRTEPHGTGWAVAQAFNTWNHHVSKTKGDKPIWERNKERAIAGETAKADFEVLTALSEVTGRDLIAV